MGDQDRWTAQIFFRYLLLQIPGWVVILLILQALSHWFALPEWTVWAGTAALVLKDLIFFPLVWRSYDQRQSNLAFRLKGETAVTRRRLAPSGYIELHGELWKAELADSAQSAEEGEKVRIVDERGLTLIVEKIS